MQRLKQFKEKLKQVPIYLLGLGLLPTPSHATTIESIVNRTISFLQGGLARSVGVAAIIVSGYLCIAQQKLPKATFAMILVGFGIIFGATTLYNTLIG